MKKIYEATEINDNNLNSEYLDLNILMHLKGIYMSKYILKYILKY